MKNKNEFCLGIIAIPDEQDLKHPWAFLPRALEHLNIDQEMKLIIRNSSYFQRARSC